MKTLAAVLAGGSGSRFAADKPKQFVQLGGRPVLWHSVDTFEHCCAIDAVVIVSHPDHFDEIKQLADGFGWRKLVGILPGGHTRSASSESALQFAQANGFERILLHDAARPLIDGDTVLRLCDALDAADAAIAAVPVIDTISVSADGCTVDHTPARETLWSIQTPQAFTVSVLAEAYARFDSDPGAVATDDGGVIRRYMPNVPVLLVEGNRKAQKLTYPEDLPILEALLSVD